MCRTKRQALADLGAAVPVQGAACADALAHCLQRQPQAGALLMQVYEQLARRRALCAVRCALCAVRCALCAVRCALCAVRCALCCR